MTLVRLTFQQLKKCNSRDYKIFLKWVHQMRRCFRVLFFSPKLSPGANQKKKEKTWVREIFEKRIEQGVYHSSLKEMRVNDRESYFRLFV